MKKVIAFDLDGTLTASKSPVEETITNLISKLLNHFEICVISGGKFDQFKEQFIRHLYIDERKLSSLHIMPTCGTRYYRFNNKTKEWEIVYAENFTKAQKEKIITNLTKVVEDLGYREEKTWGPDIEDRDSQITFSALGQDIVEQLGEEGVAKKDAWDPGNKKKEKISQVLSKLLPEFEVRVGGMTSVDITRPGIDKAYGMKKLMDMLKVKKSDILFIGDRLSEGGNDYPVKAMGIDTIEISDWKETAKVLETILLLI